MVRDDPDRQSTSSRATRHGNQRLRQASRLVARTGWLRSELVFWTGTPESIDRLDSPPVPLRSMLQDRCAQLPQDLYAVRVDRPGGPADGKTRARATSACAHQGLAVALRDVEPVTTDLVAQTARAIEAVSKFPKAAIRLVGPVPPWCEASRATLAERRLAVRGVEGWRAGIETGLSLESRAIWLGAAPPPSGTLREASLASVTARTSDADPAAVRLAAIALGRRHLARACAPAMTAWAHAGTALDSWAPAVVARVAEGVGPGTLAAMAASMPALNSAAAAAWAEERTLDAAPVTADELTALARLAAAIEAANHEPTRRHAVLRDLAVHYLQLCWMSWGFNVPGERLPSSEVDERFRRLVLEKVYRTDIVQSARAAGTFPRSFDELGARWIGDRYFDAGTLPYVDGLLTQASHALGRPVSPMFERPPTSLTDSVPRGSPRDPAGARVLATLAGRLHALGAVLPAEGLASWLEACRGLVPLASFWNDVLVMASSPQEPSDAQGARALVASLETHAGRVAAELACGAGSRDPAMRSALPAVLSRGPAATDLALRRELWIERPRNLDAALRFVEEAERGWTPARSVEDIPLPHEVFSCEDDALRDAVLAFGLACWKARAAGGRCIGRLLELMARAAATPDGAMWRGVLPRLHEAGAAVLRRIAEKGDPGDAVSAAVAFAALDVCARWTAAGFADAVRLGRMLADRWRSSDETDEEWDADAADHNALIVLLSEGRVSRLLALMKLPRASRRRAWRGIDGYRLISRHPLALGWMSAALDRTELVRRVLRLLERAGLIARLDPGLRPSRILAPLGGAAGPGRALRWPWWVRTGDAQVLDEIQKAATVAGLPDGLPGPLRRSVDREPALRREREALAARAGQRRLSPAEQARADRLGALLGDRAALRSELRRALGQALPKQRALVGLAALETIVSAELGRRWRDALGGELVAPDDPEWDNALLMLESVSHNRRVLRRLLRHEARRDRGWIRELRPNRLFLARLSSTGVDADAWLAHRSCEVVMADDTLTAYATVDPLEVLQMGSLFGTCLSADRFNAHAAVAAAVEVNKRVLYVRDRRGRVLGRQLLAITPSGEIIGFTPYGAGADDPRRTGDWVRIALAMLALDITRAAGARLMPAEEAAEGLSADQERSLSLFCTGYVDSPESFDWWVEALAAHPAGTMDADRERLRRLLLDPVPAPQNPRAATPERREALSRASTRALLWLGAEAPSLEPVRRRPTGPGTRTD